MTLFRVTDLKQFDYCPRLIYYHHCLPRVRPITYKMEEGLAVQREEEARAARRSLRRYGLVEGETQSDVYLESEKLGLRGQVDLFIKTRDNPRQAWELVPVDYKLTTRRPGRHFKLQLLAYGLLLEETYALPVRRGFLYAIPKRQAIEIKFTPQLRATLQEALHLMKEVVDREAIPAPTRQRAKCEVCEFRRFCNDV